MTLPRHKPLSRGTAPMSRQAIIAEPKPPKGPKPKKCKVCREPFIPRSMAHVACKPECAQVHAASVTAKQRAKQQRQERAQDKIKREGMKTYPQLIRETQRAF